MMVTESTSCTTEEVPWSVIQNSVVAGDHDHVYHFINETSNRKDPFGDENSDLYLERIVEGTILSFICIIAVVGNISLWIIVLRSRSLRTITNSFLLTLSAFDLLVSLINMPITIFTIFTGDWILSEAACRGLGFSNMVTLCGSVLSLCNISINRYIIVCRSDMFYKVYSKQNAFIFILGTVVVTIGVSIPPLVGWSEYRYTPNQYICFADWPLSLSYALFMIFCCFGIPLFVMLICNVKIYKTVKASRNKVNNSYTVQCSKSENESTVSVTEKSRKDRLSVGSEHEVDVKLPNTPDSNIDSAKDNLNRTNTCTDLRGNQMVTNIVMKSNGDVKKSTNKVKPEEIRLALVLGIVVLIFFISWFPYCVSMVLSILAPDSVHRRFHMGALMIGYANSCCNPIIYGLLNKRFKTGFKKLFCFCKH